MLARFQLNGCWCLPYFMSFLPTANTITESVKNFPTTQLIKSQAFNSRSEESSDKDNNFKLLLDALNRRLLHLENENAQKAEFHSNVTRILEEVNEKSDGVRHETGNKLKQLEERFDEHKAIVNENRELRAIKLEFQALKQLYSEMKTCCDIHTEILSNRNIEKHINHMLTGYFGTAVSKEDLRNMIDNMKFAIHKQDADSRQNSEVEENFDTTEDRVRRIVKEILKIYDADKTGLVDYALETAGGQIISTRCTQKYDVKSRAYKVLGFTVYHESNDPRTVIQGNPIQPGACWAFQDFPGYLLIKLRSFIYVTGFTVEHAPRSILPNGEMKSAPRKFNVWGLTDENDPDPILFGDYEFVNDDDNLQYFPVQNEAIARPFEYVELRVHSNHGQLEYTCLYRFRVHGRSV